MDNTQENRQAYLDAKRHVDRKIGFYIHLTVYVVVNAGLILFNVLMVPDRLWSVWPLLGWGIGLLFHGLSVFLFARGAAWKERMIENEIKKRNR
ncbi:2TM domain-containing protein [Herbaspirillum sp. HC18]|nr:2TM domain-containing protein [Herbaspirillum sp. HC18]